MTFFNSLIEVSNTSNQALTSIVFAEDLIMVGSRDGIRRSTDNGATWQTVDQGLSIRYVRWMTATRGRPEAILVGTEPAGILVFLDRGLSFDARPEVMELRDRHGWRLPYSSAAFQDKNFMPTPLWRPNYYEIRIYLRAAIRHAIDGRDSRI